MTFRNFTNRLENVKSIIPNNFIDGIHIHTFNKKSLCRLSYEDTKTGPTRREPSIKELMHGKSVSILDFSNKNDQSTLMRL